MNHGTVNKIFSFDGETNGLHGRCFAIGAILTNPDGLVEEWKLRCPIRGRVNQFVRTNVLPACWDIPQTHRTLRSMIADFRDIMAPHLNDDTDMLTFVPWPVEAGILSRMYRRHSKLWFGGSPFPVIDLASCLRARGYNPTSDSEYMAKHSLLNPHPGRPHNPVYDSAGQEVVFRHLMATAFDRN